MLLPLNTEQQDLPDRIHLFAKLSSLAIPLKIRARPRHKGDYGLDAAPSRANAESYSRGASPGRADYNIRTISRHPPRRHKAWAVWATAHGLAVQRASRLTVKNKFVWEIR
ncbi:hypothetical protein EVAR_95117_1 [Eumeta japonica]|uniref:Uncharacterized protein n=1 Tax=Eumeta variegata TaxID=151549 RepID=A0A4C1W8F8_EUMVA|nr:hypothetical protein EVAR_95117_1 [Eumeta japonica]